MSASGWGCGGRFPILPPGFDGPMPVLHNPLMKADTNNVVPYLRTIFKTRDGFPKLVELIPTNRQ